MPSKATKPKQALIGTPASARGGADLHSAVLPVLVLIVSLAATLVTWYVLKTQAETNAAAAFAAKARQITETIGTRMQTYEDSLQTAAALFATNSVVTREDWRDFVDRLEVRRQHPGVEMLGFAKQVGADQRASYERDMQAQGLPGYAIWPPDARTQYVAVTFVEPLSAETRRLLGYDLLSDPMTRQAMEQARLTGAASLTGRWIAGAAPRPKDEPTILMLEPVYPPEGASNSNGHDTAPIGYVYAALHGDQLVTDFLRDSVVDVGLAVYDGTGVSPDLQLYANTRALDLLRTRSKPAFESSVPVTVAGRQWTLNFLSEPYDKAVPGGQLAVLALAAGIPLSLLLFGITWSQATIRVRGAQIAREMTKSLRAQAGLLDLTHDTVFLRDRDNIIRYWNRAAADTYGYSAEDAIGRTADALLRTRFSQPLDEIWRELKETNRWQGELVHTRRDGTEIVVSSRWAVQRDAAGALEAILETNNDVTEHRRAEQERRRLEASLMQASKLEAMGTLAGGIAHDFNNILGAILGYGELAQSGATADSDMRRYLDNIMGAGHRAKSLVARILAFSRSGLGQRRPVHVQSVVAEALDLLSASLPDDIRFERALTADDSAVLADPTQIHQIALNLCTNALQAMKGGGTLVVRLDAVAVRAPLALLTGTLAPGEYMRLSVSDTGPGIEASLRERIFDPFFTTKGVGVGTGLGLSLVHGIATDLGGGVDMQSEVGRGTTFDVYLPCSGRASEVEPLRQALPRGSGETVMLVDDEEVLVRLGEELIAKLGYEAIGYTSPAEALAAFRANPGRFDVVLSDETMPGMTGSQLAERLRAIRSEVPIILMSGYAAAPLAARARAVGAVDVLAKPLLAHDIARSLQGALSCSGHSLPPLRVRSKEQ